MELVYDEPGYILSVILELNICGIGVYLNSSVLTSAT
jgi:hypothetical protein